jgi:osmotically-inducible protein OsmY
MTILDTFANTSAGSDSSHNDNLEQRVRSFLANRHVPALRHLQVKVEHGVVTLSGRVTSFYEKQLSQSSARRVAGVLRVQDRVRVVPSHRANPFGRKSWTYYSSSDAVADLPSTSR